MTMIEKKVFVDESDARARSLRARRAPSLR
jgi:hypothetical protein